MPWTPAQTKFFQARKHGWVPKGGWNDSKLGKLSPQEADKLLMEAKDKALKGGK